MQALYAGAIYKRYIQTLYTRTFGSSSVVKYTTNKYVNKILAAI
jgi:hypothetical protein